MPDIREEFEAWAEGEKLCLHRGMMGGYYLADTAAAWKAWQASRAALKVELPHERDETFGNSAVSEYQATKSQGFNDCLERVTEALQQAGIEVAK